MVSFASSTTLALFLSWTLVNANIGVTNAALNKPRGLLQQENQVACWSLNTCWNGNSYIFPLWQTHEAIYWRCNSPGMIALAFEVVPDAKSTPRILDELRKLGISATFFVSGSRIDMNTKDFVIRAYDEGHTIASRSFSDASALGMTTESFLREEVEKNKEVIENYIPEMKMYIRPPYLGLTKDLADQLAEMGYSTVMRNVETFGWNRNMSNEDRMEEITKAIGASARAAADNSFITSQHGDPDETVELISLIYQEYKDYYTFVNMETCLGEVVDVGKEQVTEQGYFDPLSDAPSLVPSDAPSMVPSDAPSIVPSDAPSIIPSFSGPSSDDLSDRGGGFIPAGEESSSPMKALLVVPGLAAFLGLLLI